MPENTYLLLQLFNSFLLYDLCVNFYDCFYLLNLFNIFPFYYVIRSFLKGEVPISMARMRVIINVHDGDAVQYIFTERPPSVKKMRL